MNIRNWLFVACVFLLGCRAERSVRPKGLTMQSPDVLFRFWGDGKIGFLNERGVVVVKPTFENALELWMEQGLAAVKIDGKWGYINSAICHKPSV